MNNYLKSASLFQFILYCFFISSCTNKVFAQTTNINELKGDFKNHCDYVKNLSPDVNVNFVGGIEFEFAGIEDIQNDASEGHAVAIPSNASLKPIDADDAISRLKVGSLIVKNKEYLFHEKEQTPDGFILRWIDSNKELYVSMYTVWNDLGKSMSLSSSLVCFSEDINIPEPLSKNQIKELQNILINKDFLNGKADGIFGLNTASALQLFQKAHNIPETGKFDRTTVFYLLTY